MRDSIRLREDRYARALGSGVTFSHSYSKYISHGYDRLTGFVWATKVGGDTPIKVIKLTPKRERRLYDRDCYRGAGL